MRFSNNCVQFLPCTACSGAKPPKDFFPLFPLTTFLNQHQKRSAGIPRTPTPFFYIQCVNSEVWWGLKREIHADDLFSSTMVSHGFTYMSFVVALNLSQKKLSTRSEENCWFWKSTATEKNTSSLHCFAPKKISNFAKTTFEAFCQIRQLEKKKTIVLIVIRWILLTGKKHIKKAFLFTTEF